MQDPSLPQVIPQYIVLKYDPAVVGIVYKKKPNGKKHNIYQIFLNNLVVNQNFNME